MNGVNFFGLFSYIFFNQLGILDFLVQRNAKLDIFLLRNNPLMNWLHFVDLAWYHRITEWVRFKGTTVGPAEEDRSNNTFHRIPQPLWVICSASQSHAQKSSASYSGGNSCASVPAPCVMTYYLAPSNRAWLHFLTPYFGY